MLVQLRTKSSWTIIQAGRTQLSLPQQGRTRTQVRLRGHYRLNIPVQLRPKSLWTTIQAGRTQLSLPQQGRARTQVRLRGHYRLNILVQLRPKSLWTTIQAGPMAEVSRQEQAGQAWSQVSCVAGPTSQLGRRDRTHSSHRHSRNGRSRI